MRDQIEADKRARAEKAAREKALREGQPPTESQSDQAPTSSVAAAAAVASSSSSASRVKKEYTETRLQVRIVIGREKVEV